MAPSLERITLGRLAAHSTTLVDGVTERFRTEDWTPRAGVSVSVVSNGIRFTGGAGVSSRANRYTRVAARSDMFIQVTAQARTTGGSMGLFGRVSAADTAGVADDWIQATISTGFSGARTIVEREGATTIQSNPGASADLGVPYRLSLKCFGTDAAVYFHGNSEERALSGLGLTEAGWAALCYSSGSANNMDYSNFFLMSSHVVTVRGPAGNWRARVKNGAGTVLAQAVSVAGVASVDMFAARVLFPDATRIEIYDDDTASVVVSFDPASRVWGGDEWVWYADTPPTPDGSLSLASTGKLAAFSDTPQTGILDAFDLGDWTADSGISLSLASDRLRLTSAGASIFQRVASLTALADRADVFMQVLVANTGGSGAQAGAVARKSGTYTTNVGIYGDASYVDSFGVRILERNSADIQSELASGINLSPGPTRQLLHVKGTEARAFNYGGLVQVDLVGLAVTAAGDMGVELNRGTAGVVDYSEVLVMTDAIVTVNGPTAFNWRARIRSSVGDVLAYADAVAGVAEIDIFAARMRGTSGYTVDVVDMDDTDRPILATLDQSAARVWGGDVYTFVLAPDVPNAPTITTVGADSIDLEWDAVADADTYKVFRSDAGGPFVEVDEVAGLTFADSGLDPETLYAYTIAACNEAGCSAQSASDSATTLAEIPAIPAAPTIDNATLTTLRVNWTPLAYAPAGYDIWRSLTEVGGYSIVGTVGAGVGVFNDTGLENETEYFYRISACSSAGCSDLSEAGSGTTLAVALYPPCTLILEVYEADGETIAWEVATDRAHPFPYLLFPSNYGSREIDPVSGAASIATVDVTIADVAQTAGNQRTGFVTERLAGIFGRRCRLRRYISQALGFYTVADGPASTPRLSESYAGYTFSIRDTRETERRLRAFSSGGTCGIVPVGPIADWGDDGEGNYLLEGVTPIVGKTLIQFNSTAGEFVGQVLFNDLYDFVSTPGTPQMPASVVISEDGEEALKFVSDGSRAWFPAADILWRLAGSSDPFNVARPDAPLLYAYRLGGVQPGVLTGTSTAVRGLLSLLLWWDPSGPPAGFPTEDNVELEIILRHRGAASDELPYYYEGNLGDLLAKLYDRELERAPELGGDLYDPQGLDDPASSSFGGGVRYDPAALAALTTPVLLRATEAVDDGRDWAESKLYAPAGFIPSIDADGLVSPVSRARPSTITGPEINDAVAEPAPDWNAGERVVTAVRYTYPRYFIPGALANIETGADGLAVRDVVIEFRDPAAEDKHGEQVVEYDASAFGAVAAPSASVIDPGGLPIEGVPETGSVLAAEARYEVLERYRDGAPAFRVAVRRSDFPTLRDGDYCPTDLSWLPDLAATLRGLTVEAVQVLSIEGLDCEWLTLLLEVTPVVAVPGFYSNGDKTDDEPVPGFYSGGDLTSDEPSEGS